MDNEDWSSLFRRAVDTAKQVGREVADVVAEALPDEEAQQETLDTVKRVAHEVERDLAQVVDKLEASAKRMMRSPEMERAVGGVAEVLKGFAETLGEAAEADDEAEEVGDQARSGTSDPAFSR